jgi:hypothetical protein
VSGGFFHKNRLYGHNNMFFGLKQGLQGIPSSNRAKRMTKSQEKHRETNGEHDRISTLYCANLHSEMPDPTIVGFGLIFIAFLCVSWFCECGSMN